MRSTSFQGLLGTTTLVGVLFLPSSMMCGVQAQKDDKDALIELLKKQVDLQQKQIELLQKHSKGFKMDLEFIEKHYKKELEFVDQQHKMELEVVEKYHKKDIVLLADKTKAINDLFRREIDLLKLTIKDREAIVFKIEADLKAARIRATDLEMKYRTAHERNKALLEQLREITLQLAPNQGGGKIVDDLAPKLKELDPPAVLVNGKIEKVDGTDLLISLGKDDGVNKNHTLDVYRLKPEPKYLGVIRIIDATANKSVGRLIASGNAAIRPVIRVGDLVTSKLQASDEPTKGVPKGVEKK